MAALLVTLVTVVVVVVVVTMVVLVFMLVTMVLVMLLVTMVVVVLVMFVLVEDVLAHLAQLFIVVLHLLDNQLLKDGESEGKEGQDQAKEQPDVDHLDVGRLGKVVADTDEHRSENQHRRNIQRDHGFKEELLEIVG